MIASSREFVDFYLLAEEDVIREQTRASWILMHPLDRSKFKEKRNGIRLFRLKNVEYGTIGLAVFLKTDLSYSNQFRD